MGELNILPQHQFHPRTFRTLRYVYPVVSRRSKGISIGINLNPDKICNFDCIYCQVDRSGTRPDGEVDEAVICEELEDVLDRVLSGSLFQEPSFETVPVPLRSLRDIAFSGDGEPTSYPGFFSIVDKVARIKSRRSLADVRLVVITNATLFHRPSVLQAIDRLMQSGGEIWAKLDAGTPEYFHQVERTSIPFAQVTDNLRTMAQRHPIVLQSLFMKIAGVSPTREEVRAYVEQIAQIMRQGGQIARVQIYTVARPPAESYVTPLAPDEVDAIAAAVRSQTGLEVEGFYGPSGS